MKVGGAVPEDCLPPLALRAPRRIVVPRGAWDTHAHVIGLPPQFPWTSPRSYNAPEATTESYIGMLDTLGIDFGVLIQISIHGTDNRAMLAALREHPRRLRGVAVVAPEVSDAELAELHSAGVRGLRLVTLVAGGIGLEAAPALARRIAPLGWHLQFGISAEVLISGENMLAELPVPIVIDHFGGCDSADGVSGAAFRALLRLVEGGNCYVKLSAAYRISTPPWGAVRPMAQTLIAAAPNRMLWGSDWPHIAVTDPALMPSTEATLDLITDWTDAAAVHRQILVENPAKLYGLPG
jgi:2-pyrone-4,6-dicarboxylate lactonase